MGRYLVGLSAIGRTTVQVLAINRLDRLRARRALMTEGVSLWDGNIQRRDE